MATHFAEFMDFVMDECKRQILLISQVFQPDLDALTKFINKVFEESIADYLSFILKSAKELGTTKIYLHTLASAVYCCTQFIDFLKKNPHTRVNTDNIKNSAISIFKVYTEKYLSLEIENSQKQYMELIEKWNKKVFNYVV